MPRLMALFLGSLLSIFFAFASVYLATYVGVTPAATAPAALLLAYIGSRSFLKQGSSEQNISRTVATAGEVLAAGTVFTVPALLALNGIRDWSNDVVPIALIIASAGFIGIFSAYSSRDRFLGRAELEFPEAKATRDVLSFVHELPKWVAGVAGLLSALTYWLLDRLGIGHYYKLTLSRFAVFETPAVSPAVVGLGIFLGPSVGVQALLGGLFATVFHYLFNSTPHPDGFVGTPLERSPETLIATGCIVAGSAIALFRAVAWATWNIWVRPGSTHDVDSTNPIDEQGATLGKQIAFLAACAVSCLAGLAYAVTLLTDASLSHPT